MERKVIMSLHLANELLTKGFRIIEVKPSTRYKGKAVFIFEATCEFKEELTEIAIRKGIKL
ncbi:DUF5659 domain-containing protein [Halobacillus mangrovi]|uniref:DUF5659 domain-containing protein n=1 Tax=Halobacillus mangrovi TaxID=402384 RepID=A0A1W5ZYA0_9BACI|nr:DUF5659 domain-containing protein [Halobacillus mangrovi]ARI78240.1 hypothetical protein HM131_15885 [Halobacillus mangrovi]